MEIVKSRCIILKKKEFNAADLMTVVFSEKLGKSSGRAFGIRKSRKRNPVELNPLSVVEITFQKRKDYFSIIETEIVKTFKNILKDIEKLEISLYILDSVNKLYDMSYENGEFFRKMENMLEYIDGVKEMTEGYKYYIILTFLRRLMLEQGIYDPEEISEKLGCQLLEKYTELVTIYKKNKENPSILRKEFEKNLYFLKKIVIIFERYINENLQVKLEIRKIIMEDL